MAESSDFTLARLIDPISIDTFKAEYWERQPLIIRRNDPEYYADLLTLSDVDHILSTSSIRSSDLRVVADGEETPVSQLTSTESANGLEALYEKYRQGATVSLVFLHERWEPLARLCRSLAGECSAYLQTNVYLTPPGRARGLKPHYDTHDVIVVQVYGSKRWYRYESAMKLPLPNQPYRAKDDAVGLEPIDEFDLHAGDLLYLPRGFMHAAVSHDAASLHLTIGVLPVRWATVMSAALERVMASDERFRSALPLGFALNERLQEAAEVRAAELLHELVSKVSPHDVVTSATEKAWLGRQPDLAGHLLDLEALPGINLDTKVRRRPEVLWRWGRDDKVVRVEFHGKVIRLPALVADELRFVIEQPEFTGRDIPGNLDEPGRMVLIRSLLKEGFLTLA